jgi:hypothetical protein
VVVGPASWRCHLVPVRYQLKSSGEKRKKKKKKKKNIRKKKDVESTSQKLTFTSGRCYPKDVLKAYMSLCGKFGLHLIVDEIYALSVFENAKMQNAVPFTSIFSLQANGLMDPRKVHVQWGLSKVYRHVIL